MRKLCIFPDKNCVVKCFFENEYEPESVNLNFFSLVVFGEVVCQVAPRIPSFMLFVIAENLNRFSL